jgi:geranylgeranyl diphosphate synthase, type II
MFEVNHISKVPVDPAVRKDLRLRVKQLMAERKVLPPSSLEVLHGLAKEILEQNELHPDYMNFLMVLLGNELWRDIVRATPFDRRLLLLPQCLRNDSSCKGVFDELGLICSGCQGCRIDSILSKAEQLGYTTLVAEGTTVAIGLIEEGAIDAVIGVSCMSVLRRSFEPVTRAAVPAIGIPLLCDGCSNTTVDYSWLFDEMNDFSGTNALTPLSVSLLKNKVADYFQPPVLNHYFSSDNMSEKLSLRMMQTGGQRIRPLLAVMAYQSFSEDISEETRQKIAIIIECFHKASLIHDDIEDDEENRYGQPVLHRTDGIPVAVNTGDYLIGKGYFMLSQLNLKPEMLAACLSVVAESHVKLAEGQGADILLEKQIAGKTVADMLHIFSLKAGEAIKVALLLGAITGGAPASEIEILKRYSEYFGIAYQIRDDLNEYREAGIAESIFNFPFLIVLLQETMKEAGNNPLPQWQEIDLPAFRKYIDQFDLENKTEAFIRDFTGRCYAELDLLQNQQLRLGLYGIMGKVFKEQDSGQ